MADAVINMPRVRTTRKFSSKIFLMTGIEDSKRVELGKKLKKLGGVYLKTDCFTISATHIVCEKLSRSEKFLGAVILGRWVVHPEYITASYAAGRWLEEADFEWNECNPKKQQILAAAAQRGRLRASSSHEPVFKDWRVGVVISCLKRQRVYKQLLVYGGAKVIEVKLPASNPGSLSHMLTYLFTDAGKAPMTQALKDYGVLCLKAEYIVDFLLLDPPPDPFDYILQAEDKATTCLPIPDLSTDLKQNGSKSNGSFSFQESPTVIQKNKNNCTVVVKDIQQLLRKHEEYTKVTAAETQRCKKANQEETCKQTSNFTKLLQASSSSKLGKRKSETALKMENSILKENIIPFLSKKKKQQTLLDCMAATGLMELKQANVGEGSMNAQNCDMLKQSIMGASCIMQSHTALNHNNRQGSKRVCEVEIGGKIDISLPTVVRQMGHNIALQSSLTKKSTAEALYMPSVKMDIKNYDKQHCPVNRSRSETVLKIEQQTGHPSSTVQTDMNVRPVKRSCAFSTELDTMLTDMRVITPDFTKNLRVQGAITQARKDGRPVSVPSDQAKIKTVLPEIMPASLSMLVAINLEEGCYNNAVAMVTLMSTLCPSKEILEGMKTILKEAEEERTVYQAFNTLMKLLDHHPPVLNMVSQIYEDAFQLCNWEAVQETIENALHTVARVEEGKITQGPRLLLKFLVSVLEQNFLHFEHSVNKQYAHSCFVIRCLWSPSNQVYSNSRTRLLLGFLESSLENRNHSESCWEDVLCVVVMALQCCYLEDCGWKWEVGHATGPVSSIFLQEFVATLSAAGLERVEDLYQIWSYIRYPWLQREISTLLLLKYDDYLVPGGLTKDPVTLQKVVSQFFYLLPRLTAQKDLNSKDWKRKRKEEIEEKKLIVPVTCKLTADKINKRNTKGETLLHRAAIKGDAVLLEQMLTVPGVDVNAQDNAGWSPLHEACNHGSIESVKALLKFVPSKTIDTFFHAESETLRRVNINITNKEGITPLHDAVLCNHIDIVKLLLQYGGPELLYARTVMNLTPLDFACSEEMQQVLTSVSSNNSGLLNGHFSQDLLNKVNAVPTTFLYNEVLGSGASRVSASAEDCRMFLTLIIYLLRALVYIKKHLRHPQDQTQKELQEHLVYQALEASEIALHGRHLWHHLQKITTNKVFLDLELQLTIVETLLNECI